MPELPQKILEPGMPEKIWKQGPQPEEGPRREDVPSRLIAVVVWRKEGTVLGSG